MALDTDKHWIRELAGICAAMNLTKVVISPGSRCAPLIIAFNRNPEIECLSIVDERSAAFFALGMAQQLQQPVGLVCTSGTAVLNYAPALAEAYYQKIPLVVFTADRPPELIDQGDGQTIRQYEVYRNFIKKSFQLPVEVVDEDGLKRSNHIVAEAIKMAMYPDMGPVHVNVPLREPLYGLKEYPSVLTPKSPRGDLKLNKSSAFSLSFGEDRGEVFKSPSGDLGVNTDELLNVWQSARRKLIIAGGYPPNEALNTAINQLSNDSSVTVFAEITANLHGSYLLHCPDSLLAIKMDDDEEAGLVPDLLITFGGGIVSKKLKTFLRTHKIKQHWHIDLGGRAINTYQQLTQTITADPIDFMQLLAKNAKPQSGDYSENWQQLNKKAKERHNQILESESYNDLKVVETILNNIPEGSNLHLGNSTPIRYAGLFEPKANVTYNSNRGTSGIDGTLSTAAGAAKATGKLTTLITGDVAFFYDSNALWNKHLPGNLRIIVINNGGGNIFRVLQGPAQMPELEDFFETKMDLRAEHIARTFALPYYFCDDLETLKQTLPKYFQPHNNKCVILEIKTPANESAAAMREYLKIDG